ncbi:MAG: hypothetical protein QOJ92_389 [Frankiales bacterium]|nr:hypothetical protein [Frankiales bacterium]
MEQLSAQDVEILDYEREWWKHEGAKEREIRRRFGMSASRYYDVLNALIDRPESLSHDPLLVTRLRRVRHARLSRCRRAG